MDYRGSLADDISNQMKKLGIFKKGHSLEVGEICQKKPVS